MIVSIEELKEYEEKNGVTGIVLLVRRGYICVHSPCCYIVEKVQGDDENRFANAFQTSVVLNLNGEI